MNDQQFYNGFIRSLNKISAKYSPQFKRELMQQYQKFVAYAETHGIESAILNIDKIISNNHGILKIFNQLTSQALQTESARQAIFLKKQADEAVMKRRLTITGISTEFFFNTVINGDFEPGASLFDVLYRQYITNEAAKLITKVNETTKSQIVEIIKEGYQNGEGLKGIIKNIRKLGEIQSKYRAELIARTETSKAAGKAHHVIASASKLKIVKKWSSGFPPRTRAWHYQAHIDYEREPIEVDRMFIVHGEQMMHPGDSSGSASNVCNCRCSALYYVDESEKK